jgi:DNA gyrase/topoisomerase IV subunit B
MTKKKTEDFKILSPRDHVRMRTGMYLGSTASENLDRFVLGNWQGVQYVPALNKMVDEIIDNCIDEAIRTKFKHADEISVSVKGGTITVTDNGRGIPQEEVVDADGNKMLRPVAAWTKTNAGTSFDDERTTIGANGVGSACTNFMSKRFVGTTWQNGKQVRVTSTDGANNNDVTITKKDGSGTSVQFTPDMSLLAIDSVDEVDTLALIEDRLTSLQIAFPEIKFKFNGKRIKESNIRKYAAMFTSEEASVVQVQSESLAYFFAGSEDGYRTTGYINGVNTRQGGAYNDYIVNSVVEELGSMIKRKHKIEVAKSTIKNGLTFVMFARNFVNPKYDSQTKERLTNTASEVKGHYETAIVPNFNSIAKKIMSSEDIIGPIVEAQLAKKLAADKRAATLAQKKLKKVKVAKHIAATGKDSTLFLCEGDSAIGFLLKVRDPKTVGGFPLRGVVMNTWDMKPADALKNKELSELVAVLGLDINDPDSVDDMSYKYVATLSDADHDGNHIAALLMAFFYKFWPRLFSEGRIHMTRTPIMISNKDKDVKWFYEYQAGKDFKANDKSKGYKHRYIKGLASLTEDEYYSIINQPVLSKIEIDDAAWFQVMMGSDSSPRKQWLTGQKPEGIK